MQKQIRRNLAQLFLAATLSWFPFIYSSFPHCRHPPPESPIRCNFVRFELDPYRLHAYFARYDEKFGQQNQLLAVGDNLCDCT